MTDITRKQYLLSSCKLNQAVTQERQIGTRYLYTGEKLNITECKTRDGKKALILGNAFCTDKKDKCAQDDVAFFDEKNLCKATRFWTGRWVLVTENMLFTDACGLIGAFYAEKDGAYFVSSSLALIAHVMGKTIEGGVKNSGLTWQLLPNTTVDGVKALVCTQKMVFSKTGFEILPEMWMRDYTSLTTEKKCKAVSEMLVNAVHNIDKYSGKKVVLALTGGKDSRVTFSALVKSGVSFRAYTAQHDNISSSDRTVPKKLCDMFGIEHTYVSKKKLSQQMLCDYMNFCGKNSNGADALFYARGQFDNFGKDTVILRSGLYEAGQMYSRGIAGGDKESFAKGMCAYYKDELADGTAQKKAFDEWLGFAEENPVQHVDIRDRFYIEQRAGGWVSAIEQSLDINDFTSIQIANCEELLSVLLSCSYEERKALSLSYGIIGILEPKALAVEINNPDIFDKLKRIKAIVKNPVSKARNYMNKFNRR